MYIVANNVKEVVLEKQIYISINPEIKNDLSEKIRNLELELLKIMDIQKRQVYVKKIEYLSHLLKDTDQEKVIGIGIKMDKSNLPEDAVKSDLDDNKYIQSLLVKVNIKGLDQLIELAVKSDNKKDIEEIESIFNSVKNSVKAELVNGIITNIKMGMDPSHIASINTDIRQNITVPLILKRIPKVNTIEELADYARMIGDIASDLSNLELAYIKPIIEYKEDEIIRVNAEENNKKKEIEAEKLEQKTENEEKDNSYIDKLTLIDDTVELLQQMSKRNKKESPQPPNKLVSHIIGVILGANNEEINDPKLIGAIEGLGHIVSPNPSNLAMNIKLRDKLITLLECQPDNADEDIRYAIEVDLDLLKNAINKARPFETSVSIDSDMLEKGRQTSKRMGLGLLNLFRRRNKGRKPKKTTK